MPSALRNPTDCTTQRTRIAIAVGNTLEDALLQVTANAFLEMRIS
jgi:hypothetical protein